MKLTRFFLLLPLFGCISSLAADMNISVEVPQLDVAQYHRPYVAFWLERDGGHVRKCTGNGVPDTRPWPATAARGRSPRARPRHRPGCPTGG